MANRIELFDMAIPAGTAVASAIITPMSFRMGVVTKLEITVPPGPSGTVGWRIRHSGEVVLPYDRSKWFVMDNANLEWPLEGFPVGNAWAFQGYNLDEFDHTVYFRFHVNETVRNTVAYATIVDIAPGGDPNHADDLPDFLS